MECTLSEFANDNKLSGTVYTMEGRNTIQRDLDTLKKWLGEKAAPGRPHYGLAVLEGSL